MMPGKIMIQSGVETRVGFGKDRIKTQRAKTRTSKK